MKEERDFFILLLSFLNPKILFFIGKGGGICAERDLMQEGFREQA